MLYFKNLIFSRELELKFSKINKHFKILYRFLLLKKTTLIGILYNIIQ
jgi:hypothetical protein